MPIRQRTSQQLSVDFETAAIERLATAIGRGRLCSVRTSQRGGGPKEVEEERREGGGKENGNGEQEGRSPHAEPARQNGPRAHRRPRRPARALGRAPPPGSPVVLARPLAELVGVRVEAGR